MPNAMGLYDRYVLPWVLHLALQSADAARQRKKVVPRARGRVLEIGIGSGLNLPLYGDEVERVTGVEPSPQLLALARRQAERATVAVDLVAGGAESMRFETGSFDTVVSTWTLCSIPDVERALAEVRRVLRPDGRLLFVEHGLSPEPGVRRWQDRLTPMWRRCAGGCHLNRDMAALIIGGGFALGDIDTGYLVAGPRVATWSFRGSATPA
jgi:ubiquinone/menaquinone biosynthesis C-methylase UbiE